MGFLLFRTRHRLQQQHQQHQPCVRCTRRCFLVCITVRNDKLLLLLLLLIIILIVSSRTGAPFFNFFFPFFSDYFVDARGTQQTAAAKPFPFSLVVRPEPIAAAAAALRVVIRSDVINVVIPSPSHGLRTGSCRRRLHNSRENQTRTNRLPGTK